MLGLLRWCVRFRTVQCSSELLNILGVHSGARKWLWPFYATQCWSQLARTDLVYSVTVTSMHYTWRYPTSQHVRNRKPRGSSCPVLVVSAITERLLVLRLQTLVHHSNSLQVDAIFGAGNTCRICLLPRSK